MSEQSLSLIVLPTGEVLSIARITDAALERGAPASLNLLVEIRELEAHLRDAKGRLTEELSAEFSRQGTKTMEVGGVKAELRGGSEVVWDVEILEELRDAGLPDARMDALVTTEITYKVNANIAKSIAAVNDQYAQIIERAKTTIPKAVYVVIKK